MDSVFIMRGSALVNRNSSLVVLAAILLALAAGYGVVHLFLIRIEVGDVLPLYSTLRADPLGAKAFYEGLAGMPGVSVRRNFRDLKRLEVGPETTLFCLGTEVFGDINRIEEEVAEAFERIATKGGRLVLAFQPIPEDPEGKRMKDWKDFERRIEEERQKSNGDDSKSCQEQDETSQDGEETEEDTSPWFRLASLDERWGVTCKYAALAVGPDGAYQPGKASLEADEDLPETIPWHAALYFTELDEAWRTVYSREDKAVLIERPYGRGSIVLSSDSYYVSNEALWRDRHPDLLAWLVGPGQDLVFDEFLKGVREARGVTALARKYRLYGLFAGLAVLAALFLWKNAASLVPRYADSADRDLRSRSQGKDSVEGLTNLLRRNIPDREVLRVCWDEWRRVSRLGKKEHNRAGAWVERAFAVEAAGGGLDPVETYKSIARALTEKKGRAEEPVLDGGKHRES